MEEENKNTSNIEESNEIDDNLDKDGYHKKTEPFLKAQERGEVALITDTVPNVFEDEELDGTKEQIDVDVDNTFAKQLNKAKTFIEAVEVDEDLQQADAVLTNLQSKDFNEATEQTNHSLDSEDSGRHDPESEDGDIDKSIKECEEEIDDEETLGEVNGKRK